MKKTTLILLFRPRTGEREKWLAFLSIFFKSGSYDNIINQLYFSFLKRSPYARAGKLWWKERKQSNVTETFCDHTLSQVQKVIKAWPLFYALDSLPAKAQALSQIKTVSKLIFSAIWNLSWPLSRSYLFTMVTNNCPTMVTALVFGGEIHEVLWNE